MAEWITIASDHLSAAINPVGAELSSLKDADGRELMTDANPAFWGGRAPLLFPVVGQPSHDTIRIDGREYPMKKHGFARRSLFDLTDHTADNATFTLSDSDETRTHYPFAFQLEVTFHIDAATLHIDVTIHNPGNAPLPASFGFHPAFAWPLPYGRAREDHRTIFVADEPDALKILAADGTISPGDRPSPLENRTLRLADDLFADDALIWSNVRSDRVTYGASSGPQLDIAFPDTPKLGIWTKPGAHFVCVEPWHGIADPEGYTGEYRDKPGVFEIAPGGAKRIGMSVMLVP
ncbi:aldose 1-epimerase family protein [Sphingomonas sp. SUN019]|uniref:aldose 1-epimerase family protein n=1 Tax=Sphingomonas sp. SUN019 TaxID=2937788 RepID=UPI0021644BDA|nr:aldose 1-epimerase family protein [Sphingomonas sp. SUN019]UVO51323.1 aldose 1-epimerase family protein [Sphingomonas sp. SUN019]